MKITVKYDGRYPNLCRGTLVVTIDGKEWTFPNYCLSSGGCVSFDDDWQEEVTGGPWKITDWPDGFPEEHKVATLDAVNDQVEWGCCGGCI